MKYIHVEEIWQKGHFRASRFSYNRCDLIFIETFVVVHQIMKNFESILKVQKSTVNLRGFEEFLRCLVGKLIFFPKLFLQITASCGQCAAGSLDGYELVGRMWL